MKPCTNHSVQNTHTRIAQAQAAGGSRKFLGACLLLPLLLLMSGCTPFWKFYDFKGAAIPADIQTFSVDFFSNEAAIVNPQLSMSFTEKLKTKFQSETRLSSPMPTATTNLEGLLWSIP